MLALNENSKKKELNTIINIALNNWYKKNDILILYNRLKHNKIIKEWTLKRIKNGLHSPTLEITYVKSQSYLRI
jgi:hypothetical protein